MRTIEEFRQHEIECLAQALTRPAMWCPDDRGPDHHFRNVLGNLCWIDDREKEWRRVVDRYLWGSMSVFGQLRFQPLDMPRYLAETTSTYAQVAWILGYFQPQRLLTAAEWTDLKDSLSTEFFNREWLVSEVHKQFGRPSHGVAGGYTGVSIYACEDPAEPWVFMDYAKAPPGSCEFFPDARLRDVRIERNRFQLLEWANWCRRSERFTCAQEGRKPGFLDTGLISIEGNHLDSVSELLGRSGYTIVETFEVEGGARVAEELNRHPVPGHCGRFAIAAYMDRGWTHIVDSDNGLTVNDSLLAFSKERKTRVFGWRCDFEYAACTYISDGSRLRDVFYYQGGVIVDRGQRLSEESDVDWHRAEEEDVLRIAARIGAPYDFLADRNYVVYHVERYEEWRSWY